MTKQPPASDALKKKNRRKIEMLCVKMVKKQSLNLLPYLRLSSNEASEARSLFALQQNDRVIDEVIDDFCQRLPQDTDSLDYSRFGCLIKAVRILLKDMQNTLALAEEELDFSKDEDRRTVLRRLPNYLYTYNFLSMSFIVPETIFSAANLTGEMEIFSKTSSAESEKMRTELKRFIEEQSKHTEEAIEKKVSAIQTQNQADFRDALTKELGLSANNIFAKWEQIIADLKTFIEEKSRNHSESLEKKIAEFRIQGQTSSNDSVSKGENATNTQNLVNSLNEIKNKIENLLKLDEESKVPLSTLSTVDGCCKVVTERLDGLQHDILEIAKRMDEGGSSRRR